ncbi:MAG: glycoside hydrolase family 88 protein [Lachnospiraceae bacterium]|nr:glycoside hydrolase family 88 protein [Lachnospiraceae bacterium]
MCKWNNSSEVEGMDINMQRELLIKSMDYFVGQLDKLMEDMGKTGVPGCQSKDYVYVADGGNDWTDGFFAGEMNLAYEYTGNEKYKLAALNQVEILKNRIKKKFAVDHHDMGFLYSPSCTAAYDLYDNEDAKQAAIMAADNLLLRYREKGQFLQAWGPVDDNPENYRFIIDCLINLPLLYRVSDLTGDTKYKDIAEKHFRTASKYVVREDFSTNHTYYFNIEDGSPIKGVTVQGYADDSMWARGQAWAIYGMALNYRYLKDDSILEIYDGVTKAYIEHLPKDNVPFWDMVFRDGDDQPRDTSSAAIAVCGILEMEKYHSNETFRKKAEEVLESLLTKYTTEKLPYSNGFLTDSMFNRNAGHKPECSTWGDYYVMEAVYRMLNPNWKIYW